jgi:hypothetical protein
MGADPVAFMNPARTTDATETPMIVKISDYQVLLYLAIFFGPWVVAPLGFINLGRTLCHKGGLVFRTGSLLWWSTYVVPLLLAIHWWNERSNYRPVADLTLPIGFLTIAAPVSAVAHCTVLILAERKLLRKQTTQV